MGSCIRHKEIKTVTRRTTQADMTFTSHFELERNKTDLMYSDTIKVIKPKRQKTRR
jgi:hypothetical protein